jgi:CRISPR-associated protein Cmr3
MAHYLLKIKPIEHFFFGVEKVGNLGNRKPYYLETTEFPQQTSILGLLRYILLLKEGKLGKDFSSDPEVIKLIGSYSFPGNPDTGYGKIKSLSPVFIFDNDKQTAYFARPLDWGYQFKKKDSGCKVSYGTEQGKLDFMPSLEKYNAKDEKIDYLISSNDDSIPLWFDEKTKQGVLRKNAKAGNQKKPERFLDKSATDSEKVEAKNEAYYKQEFLYMERPFAYTCVVKIEDDQLDGFKTVLPFGGERSSFAVSFELLKDATSVNQYYFNLQPQNDHLRIELLSDAYVEQDILNMACFAVCDTIGFRNLKTKTTTKYYSRISKKVDDNSADFSKQLQLLKRGSVLFFDSLDLLQQAEEKLINDTFTTIGYNKYRKFELKTINNHGTI